MSQDELDLLDREDRFFNCFRAAIELLYPNEEAATRRKRGAPRLETGADSKKVREDFYAAFGVTDSGADQKGKAQQADSKEDSNNG